MEKKIRTVLGDISKESLGFTYSHEHLWCCPPSVQKDRDFELTDYESSLEELKNISIYWRSNTRRCFDAGLWS